MKIMQYIDDLIYKTSTSVSRWCHSIKYFSRFLGIVLRIKCLFLARNHVQPLCSKQESFLYESIRAIFAYVLNRLFDSIISGG